MMNREIAAMLRDVLREQGETDPRLQALVEHAAAPTKSPPYDRSTGSTPTVPEPKTRQGD
jgi:hypothetical protein